MFYLNGRGSGDAKFDGSPHEDDFGWWLGHPESPQSPTFSQTTEPLSSASSSSMLSCIDSDDPEKYVFARDFHMDSNDATEMVCEDLDVDLIEQDVNRIDHDPDLIEEENGLARQIDVTLYTPLRAPICICNANPVPHKSRGVSYTPERLVRSQEYQILTPAPRYLSIPQSRITSENETSRKGHRCRRRLGFLIDSKQVGAAQLKALLDPCPADIPGKPVMSNDSGNCQGIGDSNNLNRPNDKSRNRNRMQDTTNVSDRTLVTGLQTPDSISKRSSYEKLSATWEDSKKTATQSSSLEDTSGIQSNDWSSDTQSDAQNTPLSLCEELAIATTNCGLEFTQKRTTAINEVVSILDVLETDPDKAAVLLEEDRFCDSTSSHDQLTRLALAIETDANVPDVREDPGNVVQHLQRKVEKLQNTSKDIYRDICNLRMNFQRDEKRIADISSDATKLRQDVHEMRYLDDLLNLLRGELERISKRNWPFVIGRTEHHSEEMNLIV